MKLQAGTTGTGAASLPINVAGVATASGCCLASLAGEDIKILTFWALVKACSYKAAPLPAYS